MITLIINGEEKKQTASTLKELLTELKQDEEGVATALNGNFIAREERKLTKIQNNDKIEILSPMQGG